MLALLFFCISNFINHLVILGCGEYSEKALEQIELISLYPTNLWRCDNETKITFMRSDLVNML